MIVTGWGVTLKSASRFDDLLVKSPVLAVNMDNCTSIYKKMKRDLSDSEFCGTTGTHICTTLPGSAAFIPRGNDSRVTIVGLASDGSAECGSEIPIIFTKISNYLDWIESIVWP
ncbi:Trypsin [Popillia japonica]|uniref:Trypsin n=1 Tax=Popillia japonica TaxID=7064 RepID=A0AAW1KIN8_POPJA